MADIVITAASVASGSTPSINRDYNAGATITAGQAVYRDANNLWQLAKANGTTLQAAFQGFALHASLSGQPLAVQTGGQITIGGTIAAGVAYYASPTNAGGIAPVADLGSTNHVTILGYGVSTTVMQILPTPTGAVLA